MRIAGFPVVLFVLGLATGALKVQSANNADVSCEDSIKKLIPNKWEDTCNAKPGCCFDVRARPSLSCSRVITTSSRVMEATRGTGPGGT